MLLLRILFGLGLIAGGLWNILRFREGARRAADVQRVIGRALPWNRLPVFRELTGVFTSEGVWRPLTIIMGVLAVVLGVILLMSI
jgi:hypothetical protein